MCRLCTAPLLSLRDLEARESTGHGMWKSCRAQSVHAQTRDLFSDVTVYDSTAKLYTVYGPSSQVEQILNIRR